PVDEIGRATEGGDEGLELGGDLDAQPFAAEAAQQGSLQSALERKEGAVVQRPEALAQRREGCRERQMQADGDALVPGIQDAERDRLRAPKARGTDHPR